MVKWLEQRDSESGLQDCVPNSGVEVGSSDYSRKGEGLRARTPGFYFLALLPGEVNTASHINNNMALQSALSTPSPPPWDGCPRDCLPGSGGLHSPVPPPTRTCISRCQACPET